MTTADIDFTQLFKVPDAAQALGMNTAALYKLIRDGKIPAVKFGPRDTRVPMNVVREQLAAQLRAGQQVTP